MNKYGFLLYLVLSFFLYGFLGWVIENVFTYFTKGHFREDGFLRGPFKPMYAIAMTLLVALSIATNYNTYILIPFCFLIPTTVEYLTGYIMRRYFQKDYWDYSDLNYNFQGIICLSYSLIWTVLTYIGVKYFQVYIVDVIYEIISPMGWIIALVLGVILTLDFVSTLISTFNAERFRIKN